MSDLVKGCMVIISISIATGHLGDLRKWAAREAARPMAPLPYFFPEAANSMHLRDGEKSPFRRKDPFLN